LPFGDMSGGRSIAGGGPASGGNGGVAIAPQYHLPDPNETELHINWLIPTSGVFNADQSPSSGVFATPGAIWATGGRIYCNSGVSNPGGLSPPPPAPMPWFRTDGNSAGGYPYWWYVSEDTVINAYRAPAAPQPLCAGLPRWVVNPDYAVLSDGSLLRCTDNWAADGANDYFVLQQYDPGGANEPFVQVKYPLNPCIRVGDPIGTSAFWTAAYNAAVAIGAMPSGYTYDATGGAGGTTYPKRQTGAYTVDRTVCTGSANGIKLDQIA